MIYLMHKPEFKQRLKPTLVDRLDPALHPVIRRILLSRQVNDPALLTISLKALLPPDSMLGLTAAASLLADAIQAQSSILIAGDFDADGATGAAVAMRGLLQLGAGAVDYCVPDRFEFGYGLSPALVETFADQPPDLLITVDNGISSHAGVKRARQIGCQVIITDHHLPAETLPDASAIVNPNLPDSTFASKALSGVGAMFYLLLAVRTELRDRQWFGRSQSEPNLAHLLDLVALGTVADLVPLDANNRILVQHGLQRIRNGKAVPGIMALLRVAGRDYRYVTASDLGFAVGPRLNAAGRLEDMRVGIKCLLADDTFLAREYAEELDRLNAERQAMQADMQQEALASTQALLDELDTESLPLGLCLFQAHWHEGIVGLVASKVKDYVYRPVVAFAPTKGPASGSRDQILKGSARSIKGVHIRDVLAHLDSRHPGLMQSFGGHAMAAGLSLPRENLSAFEQAFEHSLAALVDQDQLDNILWTDGRLQEADFTLEFARQLRYLLPWGQHFPQPLFEDEFEILNHRVVGQQHLKLELQKGSTTVDAIAFYLSPEDLPEQGPLRCAYRLDVNYFRGREHLQLMIEAVA